MWNWRAATHRVTHFRGPFGGRRPSLTPLIGVPPWERDGKLTLREILTKLPVHHSAKVLICHKRAGGCPAYLLLRTKSIPLLYLIVPSNQLIRGQVAYIAGEVHPSNKRRCWSWRWAAS